MHSLWGWIKYEETYLYFENLWRWWYKLLRVKKIAYSNKYDPFIIKVLKLKDIFLGSIKNTKIDQLLQIIKQAHESNKCHLIERAAAYYLTKNMNWYWPNVYFDWDEDVKQYIEWRMHQILKRKRVV